ncbi:MAG: hypothetical protein NTY61_00760 [Candidatus Parcubacteria bacterium]|nr:hypothetical protein [Candidatus Parcubacteria bacterium]
MPKWAVIIFIIIVCLAALFFWIRNLRAVFLQPGSIDQVVATLKKNFQDTSRAVNDFQQKYIPLKNSLKANVPALINQEFNSTSTPLTNQ